MVEDQGQDLGFRTNQLDNTVMSDEGGQTSSILCKLLTALASEESV